MSDLGTTSIQASTAFPILAAYGHDPVVGFQRSAGLRQEVPILQDTWKAFGTLGLEDVDYDDEDHQEDDWNSDPDEDVVPGHGEAEDGERKDEEHAEQVKDGEPAVVGSYTPQMLGKRDRKLPHDRDWKEYEDAGDVEEEMTEGDLDGVLDPVGVSCQSCQDACHRRSNVGPECERVDAFHGDDSDADQRCQGGCEDGTALEQDSHACADDDRHVSGQEGRPSGEVGVDCLADDALHGSAEESVEDLDHDDEATRHHDE